MINVAQRAILHCDLNNFYVSVASRDNETLKGKPVAVGGSVEERHGIILAKSEEAKKFGVTTGEAIWQAKQKCPSLIIVPPDFKRYQHFSLMVRKIYERYTDLVEPFGIDECWLDVTGSRRLFGSEYEIAEKIRKDVKTETGLTISVGVSFNKIFAKLGSDLKKPDAVSVIPYDSFKEVVWGLDASCLLGVGRSTEKKLRELAIFTVGDLANTDVGVLKMKLGKTGEQLWHYANGRENSPVLESSHKFVPQSIGRSTTCPKDLCSFGDVKKILLSLSETVARELRKENMEAHGICLHIRHSDLTVKEFMAVPSDPVQSSKYLATEGMRLLRKNWDGEPLRSIGIRAIKLQPYAPECQLSLFDDREKIIKADILERSVDKIRDRYGSKAVVRAALMNDFKGFKDQSPTTLGHFRH